MSGNHDPIDWKTHGVKVIPGDQLERDVEPLGGEKAEFDPSRHGR